MLFNSITFGIFLPIVFTLYWFLQKKPIIYQNSLILVASYFFYGWWDYRFLLLIFISSISDYIIGLYLIRTEKKKLKKALLITSLIVNLGILGFFKYYDFFVESFVQLFSQLNIPINTSTLNIILPVGISFYTFQTLSYTLDIYYGKLRPTKNIINFDSKWCKI